MTALIEEHSDEQKYDRVGDRTESLHVECSRCSGAFGDVLESEFGLQQTAANDCYNARPVEDFGRDVGSVCETDDYHRLDVCSMKRME